MGYKEDGKSEISYLVLNRETIDLFEKYLPKVINKADKVILIGNANVTAHDLINVEDDWKNSISLAGGYSFSGSSNGFNVGNNYFVLTNPYIIKINPDTLDLKVVKFYEKVDLLKDEVVKTLEEEVVYS